MYRDRDEPGTAVGILLSGVIPGIPARTAAHQSLISAGDSKPFRDAIVISYMQLFLAARLRPGCVSVRQELRATAGSGSGSMAFNGGARWPRALGGVVDSFY